MASPPRREFFSSPEKPTVSTPKGRERSDSLVPEPENVKALRKRFDIDAKEPLLQDHSCAVQGPILLQGRMYLFPHYVCFWSNIFGYTTKEVIPYSSIRQINKRWTALIFDNSIEIVTTDRTLAFSSFIYRNKVYDMLIQCWEAVNFEAASSAIQEAKSNAIDEHSEGSGSTETPDPSPLGAISEGYVLPTGPPGTSPPRSPPGAASAPVVRAVKPGPDAPLRGQGPAGMRPLAASLPGTPTTTAGVAGARLPPTSDTVLNVLRVPITAEQMVAQRPPYLQECLRMELPLNLSEVFPVLFEDHSEFTKKTLYANGHSDIAISPWQAAPDSGLTRSSVCKAPVTDSFMVGGNTLVQNTERFTLSQDDSCAFIEMATNTPEVAYSTYFNLNIRYEFTALGPKNVGVFICAGILWEKSTVLRAVIERNAMKKLKKAFSVWADVVLSHIAEYEESRRGKTFLQRTYSSLNDATHRKKDRPPVSVDGPVPVSAVVGPGLPLRFQPSKTPPVAAAAPEPEAASSRLTLIAGGVALALLGLVVWLFLLSGAPPGDTLVAEVDAMTAAHFRDAPSTASVLSVHPCLTLDHTFDHAADPSALARYRSDLGQACLATEHVGANIASVRASMRALLALRDGMRREGLEDVAAGFAPRLTELERLRRELGEIKELRDRLGEGAATLAHVDARTQHAS